MGGKRCGHVWKMMSNILSEMYSEKSSKLLTNYSIRKGKFRFMFDEQQAAQLVSSFLLGPFFNLCGIRSSCAVNCFHAPLVKRSNTLARGAINAKLLRIIKNNKHR